MKKVDNEIKVKNYRSRKILRILIMLFLLAAIIFSILAIFIKISIWYGLISFFIASILSKIRNTIKI